MTTASRVSGSATTYCQVPVFESYALSMVAAGDMISECVLPGIERAVWRRVFCPERVSIQFRGKFGCFSSG